MTDQEHELHRIWERIEEGIETPEELIAYNEAMRVRAAEKALEISSCP